MYNMFNVLKLSHKLLLVYIEIVWRDYRVTLA